MNTRVQEAARERPIVPYCSLLFPIVTSHRAVVPRIHSLSPLLPTPANPPSSR